MNSEGQSCNALGTAPTSRWYRYAGSTDTPIASESVYLITTDNGTDGASASAFKSMFLGSGLLTGAQLQAISSAVGVSANSGTFVGSTNSNSWLLDTNRTVTASPTGVYSNGSITFDNVSIAGGDGAVYFAVAPASSTSYITAENVVNCVYNNGTTQFQGCRRVLLAEGTAATVQIPVASSASGYKVYSVGGTDYLKRAVLVSGVNGSTVLTSTTVLVANNSVSASPSNFSVAVGRCQSVNVSIGSLPPDSVTVTFAINNTASISTNLTNNSVTFTSSSSTWSGMSVCASSSASVNSTVAMASNLSGSSASLYTGPGTLYVTIAQPAGNVQFITTNVSVPAGGCSGVIAITSTSAATSGIGVNFSNIEPYGYYLNGTDDMIVWIAANSTSYTDICSYDGATNANVTIALTGTNSSLYNIDGKESDTLTLTVVAPQSPSFDFAMPPSYDSYLNATIQIVANQQGNILYQFS